MYHVYVDGYRITDKPMTLELLVKVFGPINKLERQKGFRVLKVS